MKGRCQPDWSRYFGSPSISIKHLKTDDIIGAFKLHQHVILVGSRGFGGDERMHANGFAWVVYFTGACFLTIKPEHEVTVGNKILESSFRYLSLYEPRWEHRLLRFSELSEVGRLVGNESDAEERRAARLDVVDRVRGRREGRGGLLTSA